VCTNLESLISSVSSRAPVARDQPLLNPYSSEFPRSKRGMAMAL